MRPIREYALPVCRRPDYLQYIQSCGYITPEQFVDYGLTYCVNYYDYAQMAEDAIKDDPDDPVSALTRSLHRDRVSDVNLKLAVIEINKIKEQNNKWDTYASAVIIAFGVILAILFVHSCC